MRVVKVETLEADGGYRVCHWVKVSTDEGLVGWSEYYDQFSGASIRDLISHHGNTLIQHKVDPRSPGRVSSMLTASTKLASGGLHQQAIAAIENACLDIQGKAAGLPVYQLFGGPFRTRIPVYWTHCGSFRVAHAKFFEEELDTPPIRSLEDLSKLGAHAVELGFDAVKTNPISFAGETPRMFNGGFRLEPDMFDLGLTHAGITAICDQLEAFRSGLGPGPELMLDVSFSQRSEGALRLSRELARYDLRWLELDTPDPEALELIRRGSPVPIASLESMYGLQEFRPHLQRRNVDVAIVDVMWNGMWQSMRIATLADAFDTNVAPHNPAGELGNLISAHFSAAVPNFAMLEMRVDEAPWTRDFVTRPTTIEDGHLMLHDSPGWGADVNEDAVRERPPRSRATQDTSSAPSGK